MYITTVHEFYCRKYFYQQLVVFSLHFYFVSIQRSCSSTIQLKSMVFKGAEYKNWHVRLADTIHYVQGVFDPSNLLYIAGIASRNCHSYGEDACAHNSWDHESEGLKKQVENICIWTERSEVQLEQRLKMEAF